MIIRTTAFRMSMAGLMFGMIGFILAWMITGIIRQGIVNEYETYFDEPTELIIFNYFEDPNGTGMYTVANEEMTLRECLAYVNDAHMTTITEGGSIHVRVSTCLARRSLRIPSN